MPEYGAQVVAEYQRRCRTATTPAAATARSVLIARPRAIVADYARSRPRIEVLISAMRGRIRSNRRLHRQWCPTEERPCFHPPSRYVSRANPNFAILIRGEGRKAGELKMPTIKTINMIERLDTTKMLG